jgi:hypothetical protein
VNDQVGNYLNVDSRRFPRKVRAERIPATGPMQGASSCRGRLPVTGGVQQGGDAVSLFGGQRRERVDDGPDVLGEHRGGALLGRGVDIRCCRSWSCMLSAPSRPGGAESLY